MKEERALTWKLDTRQKQGLFCKNLSQDVQGEAWHEEMQFNNVPPKKGP
jgi:hypothetical protein